MEQEIYREGEFITSGMYAGVKVFQYLFTATGAVLTACGTSQLYSFLTKNMEEPPTLTEGLANLATGVLAIVAATLIRKSADNGMRKEREKESRLKALAEGDQVEEKTRRLVVYRLVDRGGQTIIPLDVPEDATPNQVCITYAEKEGIDPDSLLGLYFLREVDPREVDIDQNNELPVNEPIPSDLTKVLIKPDFDPDMWGRRLAGRELY